MKCEILPPQLALLLSEVGVINPTPKQKPVDRDYSFKMPALDANGEPPF
jgi:hypothetical protein